MRRDIALWLRRLDKLIKLMPDDVEAHVGYNSISVYPRGRLNKHMASLDNGYGIADDGTEIGHIITDGRLIPYSEGS